MADLDDEARLTAQADQLAAEIRDNPLFQDACEALGQALHDYMAMLQGLGLPAAQVASSTIHTVVASVLEINALDVLDGT